MSESCLCHMPSDLVGDVAGIVGCRLHTDTGELVVECSVSLGYTLLCEMQAVSLM